jgi:hypothetical protein
MNIGNIFAFVILLTSTDCAFAQSLIPKDLVGKWQSTDEKDTRIWDFQNDSVVTFKNSEFHFRLDSSNFGEVLIMNHSKHDSAAVWKIKKINDNLVNLIISSVVTLDPNSNKYIVTKAIGLNIYLKRKEN